MRLILLTLFFTAGCSSFNSDWDSGEQKAAYEKDEINHMNNHYNGNQLGIGNF